LRGARGLRTRVMVQMVSGLRVACMFICWACLRVRGHLVCVSFYKKPSAVLPPLALTAAVVHNRGAPSRSCV